MQRKKVTRHKTDDYHHLEDMAMKTAAGFFGEQLARFLGIEEKLDYIAPTEIVHLEARQMYQDFNYVTSEGTWYHLEFESDRITVEDMRRFREYEAATSRVYRAPVITCVICSAPVCEALEELTEGINTYRIKVFYLKEKNADDLFEYLAKKGRLDPSDVIALLLSPLMGGKMSVKQRITEGIRLSKTETEELTDEETMRMQAVLYSLAVKLLKERELEEIKEEFAMTILGQMLVEDGIEQGIERGIVKGTVMTCRDFGMEKEKVYEKIMEKYHYSMDRAMQETDKYWEDQE